MLTKVRLLLLCGLAAASAFAGQPDPSVAAGQAIYNQSCFFCHGEAGAGNSVQDSFWKMRIPRLNSAYVKGKTDQELTQVILNGKRKMPPAMMGKPDTAHRTKVRPEQVPALLAYVRSLQAK